MLRRIKSQQCTMRVHKRAGEPIPMLKIYFVEDDAAIRESIIRNVKWEQHGYEFAGQAPDGEIAYSEIQTIRPDVIITDLKMPFMDGLELSRLIRKEMPEVKIIILTGYNDFDYVFDALNMGVAKYLLKPVTPEALVETIVDMRDLVLRERELDAQNKRYLEEVADLSNLNISRVERITLEKFLRSGLANDVANMVDNLVERIGNQYMQSFLFRQYIVIDIHFLVTEFLAGIGIDSTLIYEHLGELQKQASGLKTLSDTRDYLIKLITTVLKLRNEAVNKRYDSSVEKAQAYILENYGSDDISLNAVSKFVNLSPTHFSMIFTRESGKTFTEFLTETRIEKAKELLLCTPKRSSEIAYEVGFRDSHYFSYVFKKVTGFSPREFRAKRGENQ